MIIRLQIKAIRNEEWIEYNELDAYEYVVD
jgi:hypothetical protein